MPPPSHATKVHLASASADPRQARVELAALVDKFNSLLDSLGDAAFSNSGTSTSTANLPVATIMDFFLDIAPTGWAELDGKTIDRSDGELYFPLFAKLHEVARRVSPRIPNLFSARAISISQPRTAWTRNEVLTLPNIRGRTRLAKGKGTGLTARDLGKFLGIEQSILSTQELPSLSLTINAYTQSVSGRNGYSLSFTNVSNAAVSSRTLLNTASFAQSQEGGPRPLNNMQPSFAVLTCIKL